jgi:hypothetical protein
MMKFGSQLKNDSVAMTVSEPFLSPSAKSHFGKLELTIDSGDLLPAETRTRSQPKTAVGEDRPSSGCIEIPHADSASAPPTTNKRESFFSGSKEPLSRDYAASGAPLRNREPLGWVFDVACPIELHSSQAAGPVISVKKKENTPNRAYGKWAIALIASTSIQQRKRAVLELTEIALTILNRGVTHQLQRRELLSQSARVQ